VFLPVALAWAVLTIKPALAPSVLAGLGAVVLYIGAHAIRIVRMILLLGDRAPSLRGIAIAHALTAPISGQLPFKVGEVVRLITLGRATRGLDDGLKAIWMERVFDAGLLAVAGSVTMLVQPAAAADTLLVTALAFALLLATLVVIRLVPEALRNTKAFLIRRYTTDWSLVALRTLDGIGQWLDDANRMVEGRAATLTLLTAGLWTLEIGAFRLGTAGLLADQGSVSGALGLLSDVLRVTGQPSVGAWLWLQLLGQVIVAVAGVVLLVMHRRTRVSR
jgi:hypothetical protein